MADVAILGRRLLEVIEYADHLIPDRGDRLTALDMDGLEAAAGLLDEAAQQLAGIAAR